MHLLLVLVAQVVQRLDQPYDQEHCSSDFIFIGKGSSDFIYIGKGSSRSKRCSSDFIYIGKGSPPMS